MTLQESERLGYKTQKNNGLSTRDIVEGRRECVNDSVIRQKRPVRRKAVLRDLLLNRDVTGGKNSRIMFYFMGDKCAKGRSQEQKSHSHTNQKSQQPIQKQERKDLKCGWCGWIHLFRVELQTKQEKNTALVEKVSCDPGMNK